MTRKARRLTGLLAVAALAAVGAGAWWWLRPSEAPPLPNLEGVDPAIVEAVQAARADVRAAPRSATAWGRLGMVLYVHHFWPEASLSLARAEMLGPDDPRWPYLRGRILVREDPDRAVALLERAADLAGKVDRPRLLLAETLLGLGRQEEAERCFRALLKEDSRHPCANLGLGRILFRRGALDGALGCLTRAAASTHSRKAALVLKAEIQTRQHNPAAADKALQAAAQLPEDEPWPDPYLKEARALKTGMHNSIRRARELGRRGQDDDKKALLRRTEQQHPGLYLLVEGRILIDRGDFAGAEQALRRAVQLTPDSIDAHFSLGKALLLGEKAGPAAETFREVLRLEPSYGPAHLLLARCLIRQGKDASALETLRAAVRYAPQNAEGRRELGALLARRGAREEALEQLRRALRLAPDDPKAKTLLEQLARSAPPKPLVREPR